MSFILDALKKSEIERQRQGVPGLMDTGPLPKRARFPPWAVALTALLAINLAVLVIVLARGGWPGLAGRGADSPQAAGSAAPVGASVPAAAYSGAARTGAAPPAALSSGASSPAVAQPHFSPMDAASPVYAPEIPPGDAASAGVPASSAPRLAPGGATRVRDRDPLLTDADRSPTEVLPAMSELNLTGADALPDLHIDVHVYATRAADRFVYINMRKYQEGSTLLEGPVLERIRRDGVVLDYHGLRFLLPRQQ